MPLTLDQLVARLRGAKPAKVMGYSGVRACCPAHDDSNPSFYAWVGRDGWLHVRCPLCSEAQILEALSIEVRDLCQNGRADPVPEIRYLYCDADCRLVYAKVRRALPGGKKTFGFQTHIGGDDWAWGLSQLKGERNLLYRLPALITAIRDGKTIYINEGEKACDAMAAQGLTGTCHAFGAEANGGKWHEQYTQLLRGASVVVVADRDDVGEAYAKIVAARLLGVAASVRVVQSKTTRAKDDAYDHFQAGFGPEDWVERPDLTPRRGLSTVRYRRETFAPVELEFLLDPYLPKGKCVLLDADGGTGKTSLMVAMAASFSRGITPITGEPRAPVRTLYLHKGEDQNHELGTVFQANGGDFEGIAFYQDALVLDEAGIRRIEETILDGGFELVVFDALFYFLVGVVDDTGLALDAMKVMERLNGLAGRTGCTIVNIRHTTKGSVNKRVTELGMGSVQFRNSHRGQLVARWHPSEGGLAVVTDEKGSLLVPRGPHFCYRRVGLEVQFVHGVANPFEESPGAAKTKLEQAKDLVRQLASHQYVPSSRLLTVALDKGLSEKTLRNAKKALGMDGFKDGHGQWHTRIARIEEDPYAEP